MHQPIYHFFFFSSRRRHTRCSRDWSSDVCSSDLLGMQCAVIEFARNVAGLRDANSSEFVPDGPTSVIDLMSDQRKVEEKGGTMRLGAYPCVLEKIGRASCRERV